MEVVHRTAIVALFAALTAAGQTQFFPLTDVKAGLRGKGKTVFSGTRVEEFDVEILGVLQNAGPKQSIILGRVSGGPLAQTGVMQGMSGSPVYVDGKLLGAVAMAFAFSKEPIAGIRPIEEMLAAGNGPVPAPVRRAVARIERIEDLLPLQDRIAHEAGSLIEVATPISFGGFTAATIERFAPQLRALGLEPRQGVLGGASPSTSSTSPPVVEPGSMISVQLVQGDLNAGADGTVTYIDGSKIYAFGHRFLSTGRTEMPFAKAEVLTLLPNLATSFKISAARELAGTMTGDHNTTVTGELGRAAKLVPVNLRIRGGRDRAYRMNLVNDRFLTPFLLALVVHSGIDATERMIGVTTVRTKSRYLFAGAAPPITIENVWTGEANVGVQAALGAAAPLTYTMQSGFREFEVSGVEIDLEVVEEKRQFTIDQVWASRRVVRPGEEVEVHTVLAGPGGLEAARRTTYRVPIGAPAGQLNVTVSDATSANFAELQPLLGQAPGSATEVRDLLAKMRTNDAAYARFWRADPSYQVSGRNLPDPPASLALILARTRESGMSPAPMGSKIAERAFAPVDGMVTGAKTIQVEIKE
jgi:hypothetical protein